MQISACKEKLHSLYFSKFKILVVMKLIVILLTVASLQVSATGSAQSITLSEKNVPLSDVVNDIQRQSGYQFFYKGDLLSHTKISIRLYNATVKQALNEALKGLPLTYTITDKIIVIKEREVTDDTKINAPVSPPPTHAVTVHVTDSTGRPLSGASVSVKGTTQGGSTDVEGNITLSEITGNEILVITFIGYETKEVKSGSSNFLPVMLKVSTSPLDEIQIQAYGKTTQRLSTGDISTITAKEIENQPVTNVLNALQDRVPGLLITQTNGLPGQSPSVQIRGKNSIAQGSNPLYVIDGVPYVTGEYFNDHINPATNNNTGTPLDYLNPDDIESISVLKDADATSIYGTRAANGAILVTTKKGKPGSMKIDVSEYEAWSSVPQRFKWMNTQQYLQMRHQAFSNDGITPDQYNAPDLTVWDTTSYTDWYKKILGGVGRSHNAQISFSGGSENVQYYVGAGYNSQTVPLPESGHDYNASVHFNLSGSSVNHKFRFVLSGNYIAADNNYPVQAGGLTYFINAAPDAPNPYNPDGSFNWANGTWPAGNPYAAFATPYDANRKDFGSSARLIYEILKGLKIQSNLGYTDLDVKSSVITPISNQNPAYNPTGAHQSDNMENRSWIVEPQISYDLNVNKHHFSMLAGLNFQSQSAEDLSLYGYGFTSDALLNNLQAAPNIIVTGNTSNQYRSNSGLARFSYNNNDEYLLNLNWRRDGTSRFGPENRFHNFWSAGAGWIFSKLPFVSDNIPFLSYGKIRGSYGTTGNDQVGDYAYLNLFSSSGTPYQGLTAITPNGLSNPYLQWELTKKAEVGLELGFFQDRLLFTGSYYRNTSSNQLVRIALSDITGFGNNLINLPATVENKGWEFTLNTVNIQTAAFKWSSYLNLTIPKNKLASFPNLANTPLIYSLSIGKSITSVPLLHYTGVDPQTGLYTFTASGTGGSLVTEDYYNVWKDPAPRLFGGMGNTISWQNWKLDFYFQFREQIAVNPIYGGGGVAPGVGPSNLPAFLINNPDMLKYTASFFSNTSENYNLARASDLYYVNGTYARLQNLALSYTLPKKWLSKMTLRDVRLTLQCQNLWTITGYKYLDPDAQSWTGVPPMRVVSVKISCSL